jgi:hypothetical protein
MTPNADKDTPAFISRVVALRYLTDPESIHLDAAKRISAEEAD